MQNVLSSANLYYIVGNDDVKFFFLTANTIRFLQNYTLTTKILFHIANFLYTLIQTASTRNNFFLELTVVAIKNKIIIKMSDQNIKNVRYEWLKLSWYSKLELLQIKCCEWNSFYFHQFSLIIFLRCCNQLFVQNYVTDTYKLHPKWET